ncbi:PepSY domain-containing protein [Sphingomonas sp. RHCKR47]|uniref:PepSY domain-containing protein n=1 Tax=Sphingomonas citricola TaxID=2862498 RepID=UPI001CA4E98B|nr:PepSY domain-containing protein [Sphingomonas citricola]MBW6522898.1 PepSY domain-containing protein [Sphingomonas citricola]
MTDKLRNTDGRDANAPFDHAEVDPERSHAPKPFNRASGYTGEGYSAADERAMGAERPSGTVAARPGERVPDDAPVPPDNGQRASFDPATGAVYGSGSGAGGGNAGEAFDEDSTGESPTLSGGATTGQPQR